jgi:hypothetical protein
MQNKNKIKAFESKLKTRATKAAPETPAPVKSHKRHRKVKEQTASDYNIFA